MRARAYDNSSPLPSVNGMLTPGGADYQDTRCQRTEVHAWPRFPANMLARMRTPISRGTAYFGVGLQLVAHDPRGQ